jgi:hypothetical protein
MSQQTPLPPLPKSSFCNKTLALLLQCGLVEHYIDCYAQSPLIDEHLVIYQPKCPPSNMSDQTSQDKRAVSVRILNKSANIKKRIGLWMISRSLEAIENVFIQFLPLNEDYIRSSDECNTGADPSHTAQKKIGKAGSKKTVGQEGHEI